MSISVEWCVKYNGKNIKRTSAIVAGTMYMIPLPGSMQLGGALVVVTGLFLLGLLVD